MEDLAGFVKAVLSHWLWLIAALAAFIGSAKINFQDYKARVMLIVTGIACLMVGLYLALNDQYQALNEYLRAP
jgi:hypothetical protein